MRKGARRLGRRMERKRQALEINQNVSMAIEKYCDDHRCPKNDAEIIMSKPVCTLPGCKKTYFEVLANGEEIQIVNIPENLGAYGHGFKPETIGHLERKNYL